MTSHPIRHARTIIDKRVVETSTTAVHNPARFDEVVGHAARTPCEIVEEAIESSARAGRTWSRLSVDDRAVMLAAALGAWERTVPERATVLTREQGKVLWESVADVRGPEIITRYFLDTAASALADQRTEDARGRILERRIPFGVTAVIVPWNTPVYLAFQHIAPALISGNTVIVKTPEDAPLAVSMTLEHLVETLPPGVVNIVPGSGSEVGSVLATHPLVRQVLFTGSLEVGRTILHSAADTIKNVGLELGGNDPAVVLPGAPVTDKMIEEMVRGAFTLTGQICFNIKRIHVHEDQLADFTARFRAAVDEICVGDGLDPASTIGPVNNARQLERLTALVADVRASGATVTELGRAVDPSTWDRGYFMLPHVVTDIDPAHELVQEEQFGPVVPVLGYSELDDLIEDINASEYGLGASVWTPDVDLAFDVGARISAGTVFVNLHRMGASDMTMPFGGTKRSGLGRTHGKEILLECTEPQVIVRRTDAERFPGPHLGHAVTPVGAAGTKGTDA